jgi:DNA recombination protein RmuC
MILWIVILTASFAAVAALFAILAFKASGKKKSEGDVTPEQVLQLLRNESDRIRQVGDEQARALRHELSENLRGFQESALNVFRELGKSLGAEIRELGSNLNAGVRIIDERTAMISTKLDQDIARMGEEATKNRDALRQTIEGKLEGSATNQAEAARNLRTEMTGSFQDLGRVVSETLHQLGAHQKERLEQVTTALSVLTEKQERAQEALKQAVEGRLDAIRNESATKLEEMRRTVDEKLQSTLETRLGESFDRVVGQLERVHKGIGEMQTLAAGVGDLKKVLSNVRVRGTFGEVQLSMLLEQFLSPEQYVKNVQIKVNSQERVEFAIKLPGRDSDGEVLLPVDAKFPQEDFERLVTASESGDIEAVAEAAKELESRIRTSAKTIREKYIATPRTTDFAILYLPTESLYAEVLRRPGLLEQLQREYHVTLAGPTTFTALLNALQMGFRTLAIEKRSSEVWQILGAVRSEFGKYNDVVDKLSKQLNTAAKSVETLGLRTRAMNRTLRDVERLPEATAEILLEPAVIDAELAAESSEENESAREPGSAT